MAKKNNKPAVDKNVNISSSEQLDLFKIIDPNRSGKNLSNTIELYDALPKFVWDKKTKITTQLQDSIQTKHCVVRGKPIDVRIKPALIEDKSSGKTVLIYPGVREELIEEALRKLAAHGKSKLINEKAGVIFTLYELQQELMSMGKSYSITEIKEGINVCKSSVLEIISQKNEVISSTFFPVVGLVDRDAYLAESDAKCIVQFHPLVNDSIMNYTYRVYDYKKSMEINSNLGRFLFKKMSHYWVQASPTNPYTPSLLSFLNQTSRGASETMSENIRAMKNALDSLITNNIIDRYEENRVKDGRKIIDIHYKIYPHEEFIMQAKRSNIASKQVITKAEKMLKKKKNIGCE